MDWNMDPNFDFKNMEITADDFNVLNADFGDFDRGNMPIYDTNYCESPQGNPGQGFDPLSTPYRQPNTPYYPMAQVQESQGQASTQPTTQTQTTTSQDFNYVPYTHTTQDFSRIPYTQRSIASLEQDLDLAIESGMPYKETHKRKDRIRAARKAQNLPPSKPNHYNRRSIKSLEKARDDARGAGASSPELNKHQHRIHSAQKAQGFVKGPKEINQGTPEERKKREQERDVRIRNAIAADLNISVRQFAKLPLEERQAARERGRAKGLIPPLRRSSGKNTASPGAAAGLSNSQDQQSGRYGKDVAIPSMETATAHNTTRTMPPILLETAGRDLASPPINRNVSPRGGSVARPQQTFIRSPAHAANSSPVPGGNLGSQSRTICADSHVSPLNFNSQKSPSPNRSAGNPQAISSPRNIARESMPRGQSSEAGSSWKGISSSPGGGAESSWEGISSSPGSIGRKGSPRFSLSPHSSDRRLTPRLSPGPSPLGIPTQSTESKYKGGKGTQRSGTGLAQTKHGPGPSRWKPASLRAASVAPGNMRSAPAYGIRRNDQATKTLLGRLSGGQVATPETKSRQVKPTSTKRGTQLQRGTDQRTKRSLEGKTEAEMAALEKEKKKQWNEEQERIRDAQKKLEKEKEKWEKEQAKFREAHHKEEEKVKKMMIERDRKLLKNAQNKKGKEEKEKRKSDQKEKSEAHKRKRIGIKRAQSSQTKQIASKPSRSAAPKRR
ncbi:hypothetical protein HBH56_124340 [Parastagonospora nodorum]|uniref:Uncharacterized protein n=2 Tax=Phaeosphaeria nodorum (strain SN15 / ATCC MYA-4574 / FGSC 10173) TaxID=321614 RepID=A0A7U2HUG8_PHANO|nr:hypothetical protein HBH56_124340 [Parastagonospora nodorum]QRC91198.1 hypothetical protein JI435_007010 [Parastagonospora nodorum SN15]KAH3934926.1 hypothetical protein HBH54_049880 [Parastagonospora nodorum]KAH3982742.1 hypothetical protein HBH51_037250 [Parastagonospora nodorum]KAH4135435.1 hypothetical protein HBH45_147210 [Parastagonospora nodorum]